MRCADWARWVTLVFIATVQCVASARAQQLELRGSLGAGPLTAICSGDAGSVLYAAGSNRFIAVRATDPDHPVIIGQTTPNAASINALAFSRDLVCAAANAEGLVVVNVSDPSSPSAVGRLALNGVAKGVAARDTLVVVATTTNVYLIGLRTPSSPHVLAAHGRTANWVVFDAQSLSVHVGSSAGAYSLRIVVTISGGDTTFALESQHSYGSGEISPVSLSGSYVDVVQQQTLLALRRADYSLAGQYQAGAGVRALVGTTGACFLALATATVQYVDQRVDTPQLVTWAGLPSVPTGIALTQAGSERLAVVSHNAGVSVLSYSPLAVDRREEFLVPSAITLQASPNPFNSAVRIEYASPTTGFHELLIHDATGRVVTRDVIWISGRESRTLDFAGYPSGSYFATVRHRAVSRTIHLLFLK